MHCSLQITRLEQELKDLRDLGQGGGVMTMQQMPLPQGLAVSSAEVISSLNEQLIQTLQVSPSSSLLLS